MERNRHVWLVWPVRSCKTVFVHHESGQPFWGNGHSRMVHDFHSTYLSSRHEFAWLAGRLACLIWQRQCRWRRHWRHTAGNCTNSYNYQSARSLSIMWACSQPFGVVYLYSPVTVVCMSCPGCHNWMKGQGVYRLCIVFDDAIVDVVTVWSTSQALVGHLR